MGRERRPIPSLLNGVSQMPSSLRHPSQCQLQVNGYASLAEGLSKRAPTQHVDKITASLWGDASTHIINWSATEQWIVVCIDNDLKVFELDGTEVTVNFPDGKAYLNVTDPVTDFAHTSIGDTVYVMNKTITVAQTVATAGGTLQGQVQDFASLPTSGLANNDVYEIVGDSSLYSEGYFMKWNSSDLVWYECALPGLETTIDPTTMPMALTFSSGTGQFTLAEVAWDIRTAGNTVSLPDPDFIGRPLRDIFFYRNRLGFLSGEYISLSRSGPNYHDFFYQSASTELATDPINLRAANVRVSTLDSAVPFNKQLVCFSPKTQFVLSTAVGQVLRGSSAALDVSTTYSASAVAAPYAVGNSMYFASEDSLFANVREYSASSQNELSNVAEEVTAHVPQLVPAGVYKNVVVEDEDAMFLLTTGNQSRLYLYKYFWLNEEKVQSAWSYWDFDANDTILNIEAIDSSLYLLIERTDGVHLEVIDLTDDPSLSDLGFTCLLDKRFSATGSFNVGTGLTTWTIPYDATTEALSLQIVKGGSWAGAEGSTIAVNSYPTATTVTAVGDYSAYPCYIGIPYTFQYRFSEQFLREDQQNEGGSPILQGNLQLHNFHLRFYDTGYLRAEVTPRVNAASTFTYVYNGMTLGDAGLIIGSPRIGKGVFSFPVVANSKNVVIDIFNDKHVPCALVSAEWNGTFTSKSGGGA